MNNAQYLINSEGKYYGFNIRTRDLDPEDRYKDSLPELERSDSLKQVAKRHLQKNPRLLPKLFLLKCMYLLSPFDWEVLGNKQGAFNPMFLLIALFGITGAFTANTGNGRGIILGLLLYLFAFSYVTYSSPRLRLPLELPLILFAGSGWMHLEHSSGFFVKWRYLFIGMIVVLVFSGHFWSGPIKSFAANLFKSLGIW